MMRAVSREMVFLMRKALQTVKAPAERARQTERAQAAERARRTSKVPAAKKVRLAAKVPAAERVRPAVKVPAAEEALPAGQKARPSKCIADSRKRGKSGERDVFRA